MPVEPEQNLQLNKTVLITCGERNNSFACASVPHRYSVWSQLIAETRIVADSGVPRTDLTQQLRFASHCNNSCPVFLASLLCLNQDLLVQLGRLVLQDPREL